MTGDDLRKNVLDWVEENRHLERHPLAWRIQVATRLATFEDMRPAWNEVLKHGANDGRNIMSFTFQAVEDAHKECRRLPTGEETERLDDVVRALGKLRDAIARAPFLDSAHFVDIDGKPVAFSWRKGGAKVAELHKSIMPALCLDDLLEFAQDAMPDIAAHQPARTVERQRGKPELAAFVRHLAARFQDRYGSKLMGTVARIASATYNDPEPVTKQQVERILRPPPQ